MQTGKYYKTKHHEFFHIVAKADTHSQGECYIAETSTDEGCGEAGFEAIDRSMDLEEISKEEFLAALNRTPRENIEHRLERNRQA